MSCLVAPTPYALILTALSLSAIQGGPVRDYDGSGGGSGGEKGGFLPPTPPPWVPTFDLSASTITMQCNSSGLSSPLRGADFGIVSYDWSNSKADWAKSAPMDCEERLAHQADLTKLVSDAHTTRVFVYRNVVKALPWFSSVRSKLVDPSYSGFFLKFKSRERRLKGVGARGGGGDYHVPRCAAEDGAKCSDLYHDQGQTPQVPTESNPNPDGSCDPSIGCDCGPGLPCGEYLFDHRNGTMLTDFLVSEVALGKSALGRPSVDGLFLDDYWCSDLICEEDPSVPGCPCDDPVQGPTEMEMHAVGDMGLTDEDVRDITLGWNETMRAIERAVLGAGGYTWWLMWGQVNANASPQILSREDCASQLRRLCDQGGDGGDPTPSPPALFGVTVNGTEMSHLDLDVAFFLLVRGPYAWIGWGQWGMSWPFNPEPPHGQLPPMPNGVPFPDLLRQDFGVPLDESCVEESTVAEGGSSSSGVFVRRWTVGEVRLDCDAFEATLPGAIKSLPSAAAM